MLRPQIEGIPLIPSSTTDFLRRLRAAFSPGDAEARLAPRHAPLVPLRIVPLPTVASLGRLWDRMVREGVPERARDELADPDTLTRIPLHAGNIENMVGTVKVPVGVIGPLRVNGVNANGDFFVPMATTEAALVASYGRGAAAVGKAGGRRTRRRSHRHRQLR